MSVAGSLVRLRTALDRLAFDAASGALVSWQRIGTRRELIAHRPGDALVEVGYVDAAGELRTLTDAEAPRTVRVEHAGEGWSITTRIPSLGGHALGVTLRASGSATVAEIAWTLALALTRALEQDAGLRLVDVRFPVLRMPLRLGSPTGHGRRSDAIVWPRGTGQQLLRERVVGRNKLPEGHEANAGRAGLVREGRHGDLVLAQLEQAGHTPGQAFGGRRCRGRGQPVRRGPIERGCAQVHIRRVQMAGLDRQGVERPQRGDAILAQPGRFSALGRDPLHEAAIQERERQVCRGSARRPGRASGGR